VKLKKNLDMIANATAASPLVELKEKKTNKIPNAPAASLQVKVKKIEKTIHSSSPASPKVGLKKNSTRAIYAAALSVELQQKRVKIEPTVLMQ
jgi:hypothetical protein